MLRKINLYGELADTYGSSFELAVDTPAEAVRALCVQLRGFERTIREGRWVCVRGDYEEGVVCGEEHLALSFGSVNEFHLIPAAMGAGRGAGKILLGLALIATAFFTAGATIGLSAALFGASNAFVIGNAIFIGGALTLLSGAAQSISPTPTTSSATGVDQRQGFIFNGATNTSQQGSGVPLVFGRVRAGSVVVSAGIDSERIGTGTYDSVPATSGDINLAVGIYS